MSAFAAATLEDLDVLIEFNYEPAEQEKGDIKPRINESFDVIGVWVNKADIIEALKPEYIEGFESQLQERAIG